MGLSWWYSGKNLPANAGDTHSIPGPENPTCLRATKPVRHDCRVHALEPTSRKDWAPEPQLPKPRTLEPGLQHKKVTVRSASATVMSRPH